MQRNQTRSDAIRRNQTQSDAIRRDQMQSDAIRRNQTQSDAIRCNQTQSDAIRRTHSDRRDQAHSDTIKALAYVRLETLRSKEHRKEHARVHPVDVKGSSAV